MMINLKNSMKVKININVISVVINVLLVKQNKIIVYLVLKIKILYRYLLVNVNLVYQNLQILMINNISAKINMFQNNNVKNLYIA